MQFTLVYTQESANLQAGSYAVIGGCWFSPEVALEEDSIGLIVFHTCDKEIKAEDDIAQPLYDLPRQLQ